MGLEFLARVRRTSIGFGLVAALAIASYFGIPRGLGLAAGVAWSLVNLFLIELLIVGVTGPDRSTPRATRRAFLAIAGLPLWFGAGAWLLFRLPAIWLTVGFTIPLAVIVLKAASLLLLPSVFWKRLTRSPWRATAVVLLLAVSGWALAARLSDAASDPAHGTASTQSEHADPHAAGAAAGSDAAHGDGHAAQGPQKFANVITILHRAFPDAAWSNFLHHNEAVIFSLFIGALICLVVFLATRNPKLVPSGLQNVVEMLVSALYDFVVGILGPKHGPRYVGFLGTLFIYIWVMNLFGLIPFMDSPTSSLNVTFALAIVVFVYAQYIGFRELGVVGWFDHMLGNPRTPLGWGLSPLMLPIHLMGELAKPISLSCRLFGNIFGEDMLLVAFATLGITMLSFVNSPIGVPLQLPFMFLALLTGTLQALVFTVLSTIYFLLMLPHDDHEHAHEAEGKVLAHSH
jgi:F-type H+-transporting ATPase subunit a